MAADFAADKRAVLLRQLREGKAPASIGPPPIERQPRELHAISTSELADPVLMAAAAEGRTPSAEAGDVVVFPMSHAQQRMWFLQQLEPQSGLYNVRLLRRVQGQFDTGALAAALEQVVVRHESLRTSFVQAGDVLAQVIGPPVQVPVVEIDLGDAGDDTGDVWEEAVARARQHAGRPFDLTQSPLMRVMVIHAGPDLALFCLTVHHIIVDEQSFAMLLGELREAYRRLTAGLQSQPTRPTAGHSNRLEYADFVVWQRTHLEAVLADELEWWRERMAGAPIALDLPTDHTPPAVTRHRGARVRSRLNRRLVDTLRSIAQSESCTLFTVLLAGYAALLERLSEQGEVVVGTPVSGRSTPGLDSVVGLFVNTVALRCDLTKDPTFIETVRRVRETALGAFAHQTLPFERLVEELQPERDLSRSPVFQVLFALRRQASETDLIPGLDLFTVDSDTRLAKFDLSLLCTEEEDGVRMVWEHSTELFEQTTIESLAHRFDVLLSTCVAFPDRPLSQLSLVNDSEQRTIIEEWNATASDYPATSTVVELFEAQSDRVPHAVAVSYPDREYTYAELDWRANQLAHQLRSLGVGPEVTVGIAIERSADAIVSLLAVLKAGGAYLSLDVGYPVERLSYMLADSGAKVILTTAAVRTRLPAGSATVVCVDADADARTISRHPRTRPQLAAGPGTLAYVIYTSGSTGTPKGVMVEHRSIVRLVCATNYFDDSDARAVAQVGTISFDASTFEIWAPLTHGGAVVGISREVMLSPDRFADELRTRQVRCMFLTAALFNETVSERPDAFASISNLIVGGEALDVRRVREVLQHGPPARLLNGYGPTECTTFALVEHITSCPADAPSVPIGRPIANTTCYVLDANGGLVPPEMPGELYLGGPGVARGYLNRPELTEASFVADPFGPDPGARLYRTGDRVRWLRDGSIEFLGRFDDQVKIRGFRVEPGEVEAALAAHPSVREAMIMVREDQAGGRHMAAYVGSPAREVTAGQLRTFLKQRLPDYMIPVVFVIMDVLPISASGKVDRMALARMDLDWSGDNGGYEAPAPGLEVALTEIWADALGRDHIGRHDNFFDLGGHSLMAARMIGSIERRLGRRVPLAAFFGDGVTIAGLAGVIESQAADPTRDGQRRLLVPIRSGALPALFCVHADDLSLLAARHYLPVLEPDRAVFGLRPPTVDDRSRPDRLPVFDRETSVEHLAQPLLREILRVQPQGPYFLTGYSFGALVAYELAGRLGDLGHRVAFVGLVDVMTPQLWVESVRLRSRLRHLVNARTVKAKAAGLMSAGWSRARVVLGRVEPGALRKSWVDMEGARLLGGRYQPRGLDCGLVVFTTEYSVARFGSDTLGWDRVHKGSIEAVSIPGDHNSMWIEPHVATLAAAVADRVKDAAERVARSDTTQGNQKVAKQQ
jgi:amino acid adenylation domain-containing protein